MTVLRTILIASLCALPSLGLGEEPPACAEDMVLVAGAGGVASFCLDRSEVSGARYSGCAISKACPGASATPMLPGMDGAELKRWEPYCNSDRADRSKHPVNCVTWSQASAFCQAQGRRLPTAEEWTRAARGGAEARPFPWGAEPPDETRLNACGTECVALKKQAGQAGKPLFPGSDDYQATAPVGLFTAGDSADGIHDLAGNVAEWTATRPRPDTALVLGGGWMSDEAAQVQGDARRELLAIARLWDVGFRCARAPGGAAAAPGAPGAGASPGQPAPRLQTTEQAARVACSMRAEHVFVTRCRQNCQVESKGRNPVRTEECLQQCGRQPAMTAFLQDCLKQAGFPQGK